jgi:peroxiredoxin
MKLKKGTPAPDFTLYDDQKNVFSLADQRGKPILLLFFPGAFTSVCTSELNKVSNDLSLYTDRGVQVVGISTDSPAVLAEFKKVNGIQFPLLSDHDASVSAQYGAKYNYDFTDMKLDRISKRSAFLIDKDGIIQYAEVLDNSKELPDFDRIDREIEALS